MNCRSPLQLVYRYGKYYGRTIFSRRWRSSYSSIYFHHVGKTGGTTVDQALRNWFGPHRSFPEHGVSSRLLTDAQKHVYFSGHMPWEASRLLQSPCLVITTVRDPVQHFLSSYKHLVRTKGNHILLSHRTAPLQSLEDFLADETIRPYTINPQCYSVGRKLNWLTFLKRIEQTHSVLWDSSVGHDSSHFDFLYGAKDDDRVSPMLLQRARKRLQRANTIAIPTEKIDDELPVIFRLVTGDKTLNTPGRKLNCAPVQQEVDLTDHHLLAEIRSRTKLDQALYDYVCDNYESDRIQIFGQAA